MEFTECAVAQAHPLKTFDSFVLVYKFVNGGIVLTDIYHTIWFILQKNVYYIKKTACNLVIKVKVPMMF